MVRRDLDNHEPPKGIVSTTLATDLGITHKTGWSVLHRLRHAARTPSFNRQLGDSGKPVEASENTVSGREGNKHKAKRNAEVRGVAGRTVVTGLVERGGELRAGVEENQRAETLEPVVNAHVAKGATVYTDALRSYQHLHMAYDHSTGCHSAGEYVRGEAHTNTLESVWALLQRQILGIHTGRPRSIWSLTCPRPSGSTAETSSHRATG